ncbi:MAG: class I SAM-dependent methyltransferase, partial [Janthinobacterium lividum]
MDQDLTPPLPDAVAALATPALDPVFERPTLLDTESAWHGHVPFAHWVVSATRPEVLVELGTHNGVSYAAMCEQVRREGLATRCYAVDTWAGDEHAGFYGEDVFSTLSRFHAERYGT